MNYDGLRKRRLFKKPFSSTVLEFSPFYTSDLFSLFVLLYSVTNAKIFVLVRRRTTEVAMEKTNEYKKYDKTNMR